MQLWELPSMQEEFEGLQLSGSLKTLGALFLCSWRGISSLLLVSVYPSSGM